MSAHNDCFPGLRKYEPEKSGDGIRAAYREAMTENTILREINRELLRRLKLHNQFYPDPDDAAAIAKAEGKGC